MALNQLNYKWLNFYEAWRENTTWEVIMGNKQVQEEVVDKTERLFVTPSSQICDDKENEDIPTPTQAQWVAGRTDELIINDFIPTAWGAPYLVLTSLICQEN